MQQFDPGRRPWSLHQARLKRNSTFKTRTANERSRSLAFLLGVLTFAIPDDPSISSLFNHSFLEEILSRHYQQDTIFIARSVFSTPISSSITGEVDLGQERLVVSPAAGHTITAFLSVAIVLSSLVIFTKLELPLLPKSPSSIIGIAQLFAASKEVLSLLSGAGPASLTTLKNRLRHFYCLSTAEKFTPQSGASVEFLRLSVEPIESINELHYLDTPTSSMKAPLVLHPFSAISVQIIMIGTIVALEVIVRISGSSHDFVDVSDYQYLHLFWTVLPALFMSSISMYFAAVDSEIRSLTPFFLKLSRGSYLSQMLKLDLLDGSTLRLLWWAYRIESFAAFATTSCLLVSSLLTIFVGSLYGVVVLPVDTAIKLQAGSSFSRQGVANTDQLSLTKVGQLSDFSSIATLILQSNLSYPVFTYESLAFPIFSVVDTPGDFRRSSSDAVNTTILALRSKMTCTRYSASETRMETTSALVPGGPGSHQFNRDILAIDITGTPHRSISIPNRLTHNVELPLGPRPDANFAFGIGESCQDEGSLLWCNSEFLYVWGHKTDSADQCGNHVAALMCNESIEAVDASTMLFGPDLRIDPSFPPHPINDSTRASTVDVHGENAIVT